MHSPLTLARKANNIIAYVIPGHPEREEVDDEILHTFCNLQRIFPRWVICTCRFMHQGFFYVSDNAPELLGIDPEHLYSAMRIEEYFKRIHPADAEDFSKCLQLIGELYKEEDPEERPKLRFVFNYRLRHADGRYLHVHDEKAMLPLNNNKNLHYMLMRDISQEIPFSGVKMAAYKDGHGDKKILEFNASSAAASQLSPRENELIPLMKQGLSTKEIAHYLGISHHTVRNMRQKLFQKFQVNNAIELLNKVDKHPERLSVVVGASGWGLSPAV